MFPWFMASAAMAGWPDLGAVEAQADGKDDAAVVVGIQDYFAAPDIPGARDNADDWFRYLTRGRGIPVSSVGLLRDQEATDDGIRMAVQRATERVKPGGTLWFVFIGHGAPTSDGRDGLLVGVDAQQTAIGLNNRSVKRSELIAALESGPQGHTIAVIDACFSGRTGSGASLAPGLMPLVPEYASVSSNEVTLFTAAKSDQFAGPLPGIGRPAFSYLALGGLQGWADDDADGTVTAREVADFTREALLAVAKDRNQTPTLDTPKESAALATAFRRPPDMVELAINPAAGPVPMKPQGTDTATPPVTTPPVTTPPVTTPPVTTPPVTTPVTRAGSGTSPDVLKSRQEVLAAIERAHHGDAPPPKAGASKIASSTTASSTYTKPPKKQRRGPGFFGAGRAASISMAPALVRIPLETTEEGNRTTRIGSFNALLQPAMVEFNLGYLGPEWGTFLDEKRKVSPSLEGGMGLEIFSSSRFADAEALRITAGIWGRGSIGDGIKFEDERDDQSSTFPSGWGPYIANSMRFNKLVGMRVEYQGIFASANNWYQPGLVFGMNLTVLNKARR